MKNKERDLNHHARAVNCYRVTWPEVHFWRPDLMASLITFTYNSEDQSQTCGDVVFRAF